MVAAALGVVMRTLDYVNELGVRVAYDFCPVRESVVGCVPGWRQSDRSPMLVTKQRKNIDQRD